MSDGVDWALTSWEGNRRRQHEEFRALPLREKLAIIEQLGEVAEFFAASRRAKGLPVRGPGSGGRTSGAGAPAGDSGLIA
ncbi:MAG: hypothetical protein M3373_13095 [Gemmatimonadota bacterium]|nr:hypothetical protein [Gemmatimonadota bacterium]